MKYGHFLQLLLPLSARCQTPTVDGHGMDTLSEAPSHVQAKISLFGLRCEMDTVSNWVCEI